MLLNELHDVNLQLSPHFLKQLLKQSLEKRNDELRSSLEKFNKLRANVPVSSKQYGLLKENLDIALKLQPNLISLFDPTKKSQKPSTNLTSSTLMRESINFHQRIEIGRASCRERVCQYV